VRNDALFKNFADKAKPALPFLSEKTGSAMQDVTSHEERKKERSLTSGHGSKSTSDRITSLI
jgi:hypothetical protein